MPMPGGTVSNMPLSTEWVQSVPSRYRSLADSIEKHYRTLVGDPGAVHDLAQRWWDESRRLERLWQEFDHTRAELLKNWTGDGADRFEATADKWSSQVSTVSKALNFAAVGMHLLSQQMPVFEQVARVAIVNYVISTNRSSEAWKRDYYAGRTSSISYLDLDVLWAARGTQAEVIAQATKLDALLASMPRRFELGLGAPWGESIAKTNRSQMSSEALTEATFRTVYLTYAKLAQQLGLGLSVDINGDLIVNVPSQINVTGGMRGRLDDLPKEQRKKLAELVLEVNGHGRGTVKVTQSYRFEDPTSVEQFLKNFTRAEQGMFAGVDERTGRGSRQPDATSYTFEAEVGGAGKGGYQVPLPGTDGAIKPKVEFGSAGAVSVAVSLTELRTGESLTTVTRRGDIKFSGGGGIGGVGEAAALRFKGENGNEWVTTSTTRRAADGTPTRFFEQNSITTQHERKTFDSGVNAAPFEKGNPLRYVPGLEFISSRVSHTYDEFTTTSTIDLTEDGNKEAWNNRHVDRDSWRDRLQRHAVVTNRAQEFDRSKDQKKVTFDVPSHLLGVKEVGGEASIITGSAALTAFSYFDRARESGYEGTEPFWRPGWYWEPSVKIPDALKTKDPDVPNPADGRYGGGGTSLFP